MSGVEITESSTASAFTVTKDWLTKIHTEPRPDEDPLTAAIRRWLEDILSGIAQTINDITTWIKQTRYKIQKWLSEQWETASGFWLIIAGSVLLVIVAPTVLTALSEWGIVAVVTKAIEDAKKKIDDATNGVLSASIKIAHSTLLLVSEEYRKSYGNIMAGLSLLAAELELGLSDINAYISLCRSISQLSYGLAGIQPALAEALFWEKFDKLYSQIDEKMLEYIANPNQALLDILDFFQPDSENTFFEAGETITDSILGLGDNLEKISGDLLDVTAKWDDVYEKFPEELRTDYMSEITTASDDLKTWINDTYQPIFDDIYGLISDINSDFRASNERISRLMRESESRVIDTAKLLRPELSERQLRELIRYERANAIILRKERNEQ